MTVRITGVPFEDIAPELQDALDAALSRTLNLQQGALAKANPKDTGRMAASWNVSQNTPDRNVKPEGQQSPEPTKYGGKIKFDGTWFISNNVPYASYVALNYPREGQKDWYTSIANQTGNVFVTQFNKVKP